ncbi:hypothetical protein MAR_025267 [Mya arenaria]|uniref:Uncharacterized protein n=1 Tax=Mya arenaria TaxID=6604 RepID=A0ABY7DW69_MYAAR|nr:hypothetical protein MAR_025267 [Mya arenaria]
MLDQPVFVPEKSHRRPILRKQEISTYFPTRRDLEAEPQVPEPVELRSKTPDLHWICWKEHKSTTRRPYSSQALAPPSHLSPRGKTPGEDLWDFLKADGQPVTYNPDIKSWTNASNDNERQAVAAMFKLQRSRSFYEPSRQHFTSISVNDPPARDTYTGYGGANPDPRSIYQQSFFPYHQAGGAGAREGVLVQNLAKELNGKEPAPFNHQYSFNQYPLHMRKNKRTAAATDDYVHEQSMFMRTNPSCSGHFIIHPDWVSERSGLRRSNSMILARRSKNEGLRY